MGLNQTSEVIIPDFNDKYCDYIRELEAGKTDIDYQDFRFSFLESEQFKIAKKYLTLLRPLKEEMFENINNADYQVAIKISKQILSIDYTDMVAHGALQYSYNRVGDTINAQKHGTIELGLLQSIVYYGDGQSIATAWPVSQVSEEYAILRMLGANLEKQTLIMQGGHYDKMDVEIDGEKKTYYFDVKKVFEAMNSK